MLECWTIRLLMSSGCQAHACQNLAYPHDFWAFTLGRLIPGTLGPCPQTTPGVALASGSHTFVTQMHENMVDQQVLDPSL